MNVSGRICFMPQCINLRFPPLRERKSDIMLLLKYFLTQMDGAWADYFDQTELR